MSALFVHRSTNCLLDYLLLFLFDSATVPFPAVTFEWNRNAAISWLHVDQLEKKGEQQQQHLDSRAGGQIRPQPFSAALMGGKWAGQREGHTDYSPMFSSNCHSP